MSAPPKKVRIGEALVEEGLLTPEQLQTTLGEQKDSRKFLGEMLVEKGLVTPDDILSVVSKRLGVRGCRIRQGMVDPTLLDLIGEEEAARLRALPMFRVRDVLTVAMAEPQSLPAVDRLRQLTGCAIRPVLALEDQILAHIRQSSGPATGMDSILDSLEDTEIQVFADEDPDGVPIADLDKTEDDSPVVNLVNMVILRAIQDGASDIHIEPDRRATRIRYRIDGKLRDLMRPPVGMHAAIASRVKVIGRMDIAEKRLPQEGRVRIHTEGKQVDLRISSMPTVLGEKIVIRILDKSNLEVKLENLGFRTEPLERFLRMLRRPYGMVLVTGPTGSGKTTTLYSALSLIRSPELNIITVEDPVEYQLELINQVQVQESIGMTFARALRSILRQDPDVIMVGEIRDQETAAVAVQAALTGHLVLATLHTNDAPSAIARLIDMGVEPYLLSGALNGIAAQRLVRTVCPSCRTTYEPDEEVLREAGLLDTEGAHFTRGVGCVQCHDSGFSGRMGIYEVLELSPELRRKIRKGVTAQDFRDLWRKLGGVPLRQEGLLVAREGRTTLEEALAVTHSEGEELPEAAGRALAREPVLAQ